MTGLGGDMTGLGGDMTGLGGDMTKKRKTSKKHESQGVVCMYVCKLLILLNKWF